MVKKDYIIWGATGQSLVIEEALHGSNYAPIAIFDNAAGTKSPFENVPIFYGKPGFANWKHEHFKAGQHFVVAIGGGRGADRVAIHRFLQAEGLLPFNVLHPKAHVAYNATLGEGVQLMASATVCARAVIHDCVIINTSANVDHECVLHAGVHIGPGASLAGCVEVGENSFIGTNATILPRVQIGKNVIVGAGAVITKNIPDNCTVVGNPARELLKK